MWYEGRKISPRLSAHVLSRLLYFLHDLLMVSSLKGKTRVSRWSSFVQFSGARLGWRLNVLGFLWICSATKWIPVRFLNEHTLRNKLLVMGVALFRLSFASTYEKVFSWMLKLCANERFVVVFTPRQSGLGYFIYLCVYWIVSKHCVWSDVFSVPHSSSWI